MGSVSRAFVVLCSVIALAGFGCGDKKKESDEPEACTNNKDCERGLVCLDSECADPRVMKGPSNMVTPDKVKREVEAINKKADERNQKALDL